MVQNFEIPSLKQLYSRSYDEKMNEWRRLDARDKARNIARALDTQGIKFTPSTVLEVGAGTGDVLKALSTLVTVEQFVGLEIDVARTRIEGTSNLKSRTEIISYDGRTVPPEERRARCSPEWRREPSALSWLVYAGVSAWRASLPSIPQNPPCHEKRGAARVDVIIRDGTPNTLSRKKKSLPRHAPGAS